MKVDITRVTDAAELERVIDLCAKVFSAYHENVEHWRLVLKTDPGYAPGQNFVVYADGRPVSNVRLTRRRVRVGIATTTLGFVGDVSSDPAYRGRHYATACLEEAARFMRETGCTISLLTTGIHDFYRRLGWEIALANCTVRFDPRRASQPAGEWQVATYEESRLDVVARMYERENASRTLSVARDLDYWRGQLAFSLAVPVQGPFGFLKEDPAGFLILMDADGQPRAYARSKTEGERLLILESAAESREAAAALIWHLAQRSPEARAATMECPPDSLTAFVAVRELGGEAVISRSGRMVRLMDLPCLFRDVRAAFEDRLRRCPAPAGAIWLEAGPAGSAGVEWDGESAQILEKPCAGCLSLSIPQRKMAGLVTGYQSVSDVLEQAGLAGQVGKNALALMDALFPQGHAHMWEMDTA